MKESRHRARGFTLIEMLVCLALMALVSVVLVTSLRFAGRAWQRVSRSAEAVDEVELTQSFLRAKLSSLYPASGRGEGDSLSALQSDGQFLEFSSIAPQSRADGIVRYRIALSGTTPSMGITLLTGPEGQEGLDRPSERLLKNVSSMKVQFYRQPRGQPGQWLDSWDSSSEVPRLIRIDVRLPESDPRRWPPLYVEPRVDTPVTCQFDTVSHRCRTAT